MGGYFITAIGTGVGKTFTTCALLEEARRVGLEASAYKPVISGWQEQDNPDTSLIIAAGGNRQLLEDVSPWRFTAPLSPHRAAALEGRHIPFEDLCAWTSARIQSPELVLVEGVGGVMVPLTDTHTSIEWMQAVGVPVILVTGSYLGSISHTLTAISVLEAAGIQIDALVMNESCDSSVAFAEAQEGLSPFIRNIPLRIFQPRVSSPKAASEIAGLLAQLR